MRTRGRVYSRMRWPMVRSACPPARSASIREHLTKRMSPPRRATWCPSACATWVLPTPTGP
jgi:hypothetical protein